MARADPAYPISVSSGGAWPATRAAALHFVTLGAKTPESQRCEGLDRRCPPSLWSLLEAVGTACRLPPREVPEI